MSNNDSGNNSPTDIITYIGVPLAVLGVLPILYNTLSTLAALSKIKRMLRRGKLTALTRSDIINKVIEVELPRYAVQPWDRYNHRSEYWQLSRQPSSIPGGSWTTFNWKTNTIGIKTQRLEYADQLRQPQVEVEFQELVAYLLDLGGVPNAQGWRMLRSSGLWTPTGCSLMSSPDGTRPALKMSSLDDSDGHLSLKVTWEPSWTTRDASTLPPYWIRLPPPPPAPKETASSAEASTSQEVAGTETATEEEKTGNDESSEGDTEKEKGKDKKEKELTPKQSMDSVQKQAEKNASEPIICQFTVDGLQSALSQDFAQSPSRVPSTFSSPSSAAALEVQSLYIDHLRVTRNGRTNGTWFASAATAYGTTSQTVLWNYLIPEEILNFSRRDSVPCGVLEILGVVSSEKTPQWQMNSTDNDSMEAHELFIRRMREQRDAMAAEAKMDPAQRQFAASQRMHREMAQRMDDMRDQSRRDTQRRITRRNEALQSPKWDNRLVAEYNLSWLRSQNLVPQELSLREIVGTILHRMVLDGQLASEICGMLDVWKAWADNGGMRIADLDTLQERQATFAQASLLVALIKDATSATEGTLAMDLQECLRMWRVVRLG